MKAPTAAANATAQATPQAMTQTEKKDKIIRIKIHKISVK